VVVPRLCGVSIDVGLIAEDEAAPGEELTLFGTAGKTVRSKT